MGRTPVSRHGFLPSLAFLSVSTLGNHVYRPEQTQHRADPDGHTKERVNDQKWRSKFDSPMFLEQGAQWQQAKHQERWS